MSEVNQKKNHMKTVWLVLLGMIAVIAFVFYFGIFQHVTTHKAADIKIDGFYLPTPKLINEFHLSGTNNKPFTNESLQGHWTMMFFGFTNCGQVCPMTMAAVSKMYRTLQEELPNNQLPHVVMISVDPDRDNLARMKSYVTSFNPNFLGARSDIHEITRIEKNLNIVAVKIMTDMKGKDHYTIDHSAEILLINPQGQVQAYMSYPHKPEQMVKDYKLILASQPA